MRSRAAVVVALLCGALLGFGLSRLRSPETLPGPADVPRSPGAASAVPPPAASQDSPEAELLRLRQENARLRDAIDAARPSAPATESPAARRERAKSIFDTFRRALVDKEGSELLKALGSVDELDPSMAAFFVERQREGIENRELRDMNLLLIHLCGGPDAAAFVADLLRDPASSRGERLALLQNLSGTGLPENRKLPYTGEIAVVAETLLASADPFDRMGGAGLLGGNDSDETRVRLLRMAQSDAAPSVRSAALSSLGWVGDRAAYERLKEWKTASSEEKNALERALAQLKRRFPN